MHGRKPHRLATVATLLRERSWQRIRSLSAMGRNFKKTTKMNAVDLARSHVTQSNGFYNSPSSKNGDT
jgi:hypothetical protein